MFLRSTGYLESVRNTEWKSLKPRAKGYSFDGEGGMESEMITVRSFCDTKWQTSEEKTVCRK